MFDITHSGEVEYRTFIWDPDLLESLHLEARGPLFSIKSPQGSVSQLQLPHCEPEPLSDSLSVLHITDYGTSRLQPVMVTESHVVVNVPHLSLFGIVINLIRNLTTKTNGQVLLFQDSTNNFFSIHVVMLPSNVPLYQVKEFHSDSKFIKVPSHCIFYKDQTYSCHSDPGDFKIQPSKAEVSANYGPNYHPLFSMRLPLRTEEVTIFIKDQEDQVMWMYTLHQSEMTEHEQKDRSFSTEKFKQIGPGFVERVSEATLDSLLFTLHQCGAITSEEEEYIRAANQRSKKARQLFDIVTKKGLSSLLMKNLKDEDTFLYQELCLM
ncbi:hypothetical protein FQA47_005431 [Oryzias melastigma]|uniref:FIIND domain-containing protein n=1 Tax=Oryzias melastigma TaxID=30732 RepID=A0A834BVN8_ORYME|nr:hypothetical protein FQA47_005431 [Oryzias melastigma]